MSHVSPDELFDLGLPEDYDYDPHLQYVPTQQDLRKADNLRAGVENYVESKNAPRSWERVGRNEKNRGETNAP